MNISIKKSVSINSLEELRNLKQILEVNQLDKPNYSKIAKELGVDRRTVKKYYENKKDVKTKRNKKSKLDAYYNIIDELLFGASTQNNNKVIKQIFYYKDHLYRYLVREKNLMCSRSNFNYYIRSIPKFAQYFNAKEKNDAIKTETPFGVQAQFDWKEKLKFYYQDGTHELINIGCLILSASRMKIWGVYTSTNQECLFDFFSRSLQKLGGVPKEIVIDNAVTMMDNARTEKSEGKLNPPPPKGGGFA